MNKNIFKHTLLFSVLFILSLPFYFILNPFLFVPDVVVPKMPDIYFASCRKDDDCIKVRNSICSCGSGGKAIAINRVKESQWDFKLYSRFPRVGGCLAFPSQDASCMMRVTRCSNFICKLGY